MVLLLSDPRVSAVEVRDDGEPLVPLVSRRAAPRLDLDVATGRDVEVTRGLVIEQGADVQVRDDVARRLGQAAALLPEGVSLKVVEGHRRASEQSRIVAEYTARLRASFPAASHDELLRLSSRFVAPLDVAPHVAGAAVDVKLVDVDGRELDMGTPLDATPEQSDNACYFAAANISGEARRNRAVLAAALGAAGMVNYPTEWWHWSYGDRYWAVVSGAQHALYGPVAQGAERATHGPVAARTEHAAHGLASGRAEHASHEPAAARAESALRRPGARRADITRHGRAERTELTPHGPGAGRADR